MDKRSAGTQGTQLRQVSRRGLLRAAGGIGAAAVLAPASLAGCSTAKNRPGGSAGTVKLPVRMSYTGAKPDIRSTGPHVLDGFFRYPYPPPDPVPGMPGKGGTVTASVDIYAGVPAPMSRNAWWQAVNKRLGVTLTLDGVPYDQYDTKLATLLAGGALPDLVRFKDPVPHMDQLLPAKFADLSDYLSGDAVKKYPMLANLPPDAWKIAAFGGGFYGVPMVAAPFGPRDLVVRADIIDSLGLSLNPGSGAEFLELCRGLTDAKKNRWAMCQPAVAGPIPEMFGVPNNWREEGGKFTKDIETDEYKQALAFVKKMWDEGLFYPDSFSATVDVNGLYGNHRSCMIVLNGDGMTLTYPLTAARGDKGLRMVFMPVPKYEGGGLAGIFQGAPAVSFTAINGKLPKQRVDELLRIMNLLAAPFGTAEYLLVNFGAEGVDYTFDHKVGVPVATAKFAGEKPPVNYLPGSGPRAYFTPGHPEVTRMATAYAQKVSKNVVADPSFGVFSKTQIGKGATLTTLTTSAAADVVQGRKSLSQWGDVVTQWRQQGGDQIRSEYQAALHKTGGR